MSVAVPLDQLRAEIDRHGRSAYLLTTSDDLRPHVIATTVSWVGDELLAAPGTTTVANASERPLVSLLWATPSPEDYSLIIDGLAVGAERRDGGGNLITIRPTKAVLHRPAADGGHDCRPVYSGTGDSSR